MATHVSKDYDIKELLSEVDFHKNAFKDIGNGLLLTNREIEVLNKNKIAYQQCQSLKEILYKVEDLISEMGIVDEELDEISQSISERDYYQNTNK